MVAKSALVDPLAASSYFHPSGGAEYAPLRAAIVEKATMMGYEVLTMSEHGVTWVDDQDPFGHVNGAAYMRLVFQANFRVLESFAKSLKDKFDDFHRARGVGILNKTYDTDIKRQVVYPDCVSLCNTLVQRVI
jgi:hypothetical protein